MYLHAYNFFMYVINPEVNYSQMIFCSVIFHNDFNIFMAQIHSNKLKMLVQILSNWGKNSYSHKI